jgi:putative FmdB family regulatory protein
VIGGFSIQEVEMPEYEFVCEKCKKAFTLALSISDYEKKIFKCPKCDSKKVAQQISIFQTRTSRKS